MNKDLKTSVISTLLGAALASGAFIGKDWFEKRNQREAFAIETYKSLYEKLAARIDALDVVYSDMHQLFGETYAITTYEFQSVYGRFQEAVESYSKYVKELERYGTSGQVAVAKNLLEWVNASNAELKLQHDIAEQAQRRARELLLLEEPTDDFFDALSNALTVDLKSLVQNENRVYYEISSYRKPVIDAMGQNLNYQFRRELGLEFTADIAETINGLPELAKRDAETSYKDQELPFMFAENREFLAPTLIFSVENDLFIQKNKFIEGQVQLKFLASVLEHDEALQDALKAKKSKGRDGG